MAAAAFWISVYAGTTLNASMSPTALPATLRGSLGPPPPTLLMSTLILPSSSTVRTMSLSRSSSLFTSPCTAMARRPSASISALTACRSASVRANSATSAPALASVTAHARPIPLPAPVTTATFPSSENWRKISFMSLPMIAFRPAHALYETLSGHQPNGPWDKPHGQPLQLASTRKN